jgi:uncharacterized Zn finger protein (UPF0148 family)
MECSKCGHSGRFRNGSGYLRCPNCGKKYSMNMGYAGNVRGNEIPDDMDTWKKEVLSLNDKDRKDAIYAERKKEIEKAMMTQAVRRKRLEKLREEIYGKQ